MFPLPLREGVGGGLLANESSIRCAADEPLGKARADAAEAVAGKVPDGTVKQAAGNNDKATNPDEARGLQSCLQEIGICLSRIMKTIP